MRALRLVIRCTVPAVIVPTDVQHGPLTVARGGRSFPVASLLLWVVVDSHTTDQDCYCDALVYSGVLHAMPNENYKHCNCIAY